MDIYHSKIGDFWLEADGNRIPFKLIAKSRKIYNTGYSVRDRKVFKPIVQPNRRIDKLALKTNINFSEFMENDIISDEFVCGYDLIDNDYKTTFGTAVYTSSWDSKVTSEGGIFLEESGDFNKHELPSYLVVDDASKCRFSFAFREFKNFDDLSVDFACDFIHPKMEKYEEYVSDLAYDVLDNLSENERNDVLRIKDNTFLEHHNFDQCIRNKYGLQGSEYGNGDDISADVVKLVCELLE